MNVFNSNLLDPIRNYTFFLLIGHFQSFQISADIDVYRRIFWYNLTSCNNGYFMFNQTVTSKYIV